MSPDTRRWIVAVRLAGASAVCLLVLAVTIPNPGSVSLPHHRIGYGRRDVLCVAVILGPLILNLAGAAWSRFAECLGWVLLTALVVLRFVVNAASL
jgi:hypothetical protein